MSKIYTLDGKLLTGCPEIRIKDKVYTVDDRVSTVNKIIKLSNSGNENSDEILEIALGKKQFKEIKDMDMPFVAYIQLVKLTVAAMTGEEVETVDQRFQDEKQHQ